MGKIIAMGGRAAHDEPGLYDAVRRYYQTVNDMPEPYREISLTAVRGLLFKIETIQAQLTKITNSCEVK